MPPTTTTRASSYAVKVDGYHIPWDGWRPETLCNMNNEARKRKPSPLFLLRCSSILGMMNFRVAPI